MSQQHHAKRIGLFGWGFLLFLTLCVLPVAMAQKEMPKAEVVPLKKLRSKDESAARETRDRADIMRAEVERYFFSRLHPSEKLPPLSQAERDAKAIEVIHAYLEVIEQYPHTEIAAYCTLRLSGFLGSIGEPDQALKLLTSAVAQYAGTEQEREFIFNIGLHHLQRKDDPAEAAKWFAKILKPVKPVDSDDLEERERQLHQQAMDNKFNVTAQELLAKCELLLKQDAQDRDGRYTPQVARKDTPKEIKAAIAQVNEVMRKVAEDLAKEAAELAALSPEVHMIRDMLDKFENLWRESQSVQDQTFAAMAQYGDVAVLEIERRLVDGEGWDGWQHPAVRVLHQINTEKSRTLLRRMALGEIRNGNMTWAASRLVDLDRSEAANLLTSTTAGVLGVAFGGIYGEPIDDDRMALLRKCFDIAPGATVSVMAAGTTGELANETVEFIGKVLNGVADLPEVDVVKPQYHGIASSEGEQSYQSYINVLASVRVDDDSVIHELTGQLQGRAKDAVFLALARRGDKSVHEEVIRIAEDAEAGLFRAWAARALGEIGTHDDLPFLRTLAENDPLTREVGGMRSPLDTGPFYPVREAAKDAIRAIEQRVGTET